MNKASRFALAVFSMCVFANAAWSQASPRPEIPPPSAVDLSMEEAKVEIRLTKQEGDASEFCLTVRCSSILADVDGTFVMRPPPSLTAAVYESRLYFPVSYSFGPTGPNVHRFNVLIDGAAPRSRIKAFPEPAQSEWDMTDEANRRQTQDGYSWPVTFSPGRARAINVHYTLLLPRGDLDEKTLFVPNDKGELVYSDKAQFVEDDKARFVYFLRSAALWRGTFGKETIHVVADKGLKLEIQTPKNLKPKTASDNEITWEIENAVPAEDIRLVIASDAAQR